MDKTIVKIERISDCFPKLNIAKSGFYNFETGAANLYMPAFQKLAARVGLAPTQPGLTGRRATLTLSGNGAAGRILTCIYPLRRRMPDLFGHGSVEMVGMAGFSPAASRSQAGCSKD